MTDLTRRIPPSHSSRQSARWLLALAVLSLFVHFVSGVSMHLPVSDRFDFSSAICVTGAPSAGADRSAGQSSPADDKGAAVRCCSLCGPGSLPIPVVFSGILPTVALPAVLPAVAVSSVSGFLAWVPHSPRAPPLPR